MMSIKLWFQNSHNEHQFVVSSVLKDDREYSHKDHQIPPSYLAGVRESVSADDGAVVAHVLDGAADARLVDGLAAGHLQRALLHHARRVVPDAVAQLARLVGVPWDLKMGFVMGSH